MNTVNTATYTLLRTPDGLRPTAPPPRSADEIPAYKEQLEIASLAQGMLDDVMETGTKMLKSDNVDGTDLHPEKGVVATSTTYGNSSQPFTDSQHVESDKNNPEVVDRFTKLSTSKYKGTHINCDSLIDDSRYRLTGNEIDIRNTTSYERAPFNFERRYSGESNTGNSYTQTARIFEGSTPNTITFEISETMPQSL